MSNALVTGAPPRKIRSDFSQSPEPLQSKHLVQAVCNIPRVSIESIIWAAYQLAIFVLLQSGRVCNASFYAYLWSKSEEVSI